MSQTLHTRDGFIWAARRCQAAFLKIVYLSSSIETRYYQIWEHFAHDCEKFNNFYLVIFINVAIAIGGLIYITGEIAPILFGYTTVASTQMAITSIVSSEMLHLAAISRFPIKG